MTTKLQTAADVRADRLRRAMADDLRRMREDAGVTRVALASAAGVDPSLITKAERLAVLPTLETYARICAALGADLHLRAYPNTGPLVHDRHQVSMAELLLETADHGRWDRGVEVGVRHPVRGWIDVALHDPRAGVVVASELESLLRRIEQLIRWSGAKADALPSAAAWPGWAEAGPPSISRLLVVRWTRANRQVVDDARRQLREAYPADPRDALDALTSRTVAWPGPALLWARVDGRRRALVPG